MRPLLFLLLAMPSLAQAAASSAAASTARPARPLPTDSLLEVVVALGAVVAVIFALGWLIRRMQSGAGFSTRGMRVVAMLPLSARERAVLVQVGDRQLLLGVAPGRVNLLQSFDEPVIDAATTGGEFSERLKQALRPGRTS